MSIWAWTRPKDGFLATPAPEYSSFLFPFFVYHDDHGLAIRYNYKTNQTTKQPTIGIHNFSKSTRILLMNGPDRG